jgi:hypothetical protein
MAAEPSLPGWHLHAPQVNMGDGVVRAQHGFVLRTSDGWTLTGNALRWDLDSGDVFATGAVVLTIPGGERDGVRVPGVRLEAEHLGFHRSPSGQLGAIAEHGEAWEVRAFLRMGQRLMRLSCDHARFDRKAITLEGLRGDGGHGGLFGIAAGSFVIGLRETPAEDRQGFERQVEDISAYHLRPTLAGVPFFYSPVVYRDFRLDYPWTRYEVGASSRLGYFGRAWLGLSLPPIADWRFEQKFRLDYYSEAGVPLGSRTSWAHPDFGEGQFLYFGFDQETVLREQDQPLGERSAYVLDAEHRLDWSGGAAYGRAVHLPDADPGFPQDERFRNDYLNTDLYHRPLARQGLAIAQSWAGASVVLDTDTKAHEGLDETDRLFGAQVLVPTISLGGPLSASGQAWGERLEQDTLGESADRLRYSARFGGDHWFDNGLGIGAGLGAQGLSYFNGAYSGIDIDDAHRVVPQADAHISYQMVGRFGDVSHRMVPTIGLIVSDDGQGDTLPVFNFDDNDDLTEDTQQLELGFETDLTRNSLSFRFSGTTLWGIRDEDLPAGRTSADNLGQHLRSAVLDFTGRPIASLDLDARGVWDGDLRRWQDFDSGLAWVPHYRTELRARATWRPDDDAWQFRPGMSIHGDRYHLDADTVFDDNGEEFRSIAFAITRSMVDGELRIGYRIDRDADGREIDQSITVAFSIDTFNLY